jgi:hypothetical protein
MLAASLMLVALARGAVAGPFEDADAARARFDRVQAVLQSNSPETVADALKNDPITKLRSQYLELARREAEWSARYGPDHLAVVNIRNQMREIQNSIRNELQSIAETTYGCRFFQDVDVIVPATPPFHKKFSRRGTATPLYSETATLLFLPNASLAETEAEVLGRSDSITLGVVKDLKLTDDPEFVDPTLGLFSTIFGSIFRDPEDERRVAVKSLQRNLTIRVLGRSPVDIELQVSFRSPDPEKAARVANAIVNAVAQAYCCIRFAAGAKYNLRSGLNARSLPQERETRTPLIPFQARTKLDGLPDRSVSSWPSAEMQQQRNLLIKRLAEIAGISSDVTLIADHRMVADVAE